MLVRKQKRVQPFAFILSFPSHPASLPLPVSKPALQLESHGGGQGYTLHLKSLSVQQFQVHTYQPGVPEQLALPLSASVSLVD